MVLFIALTKISNTELKFNIQCERRLRSERTKKKTIEEKSLLLLRRFFTVTRIPLIGLDIFLVQVNHEEKSHADRTNRHISEQVNREDKTVSNQFTNKESMLKASDTVLLLSRIFHYNRLRFYHALVNQKKRQNTVKKNRRPLSQQSLLNL